MNQQNQTPPAPRPGQHYGPAQMPPIPPAKSGMAIAGFVLGLIAILTSFLPIINNLSFLLAILGLVFGTIGFVGITKGKKSGKGFAIAAIVLCVISGAVVLATQGAYSSALDSAASSTAVSASSDSQSASGSSGSTNASSGGNADASSSNNDSTVSAEYRNALTKAQQYSDNMHMSKQGIYDQLTSEYGEKFPADAAQYAIDNVKADWNANALAKAKTYQDQGSMSKSAIHDQLTSEYGEQFTQSEADYAIANL